MIKILKKCKTYFLSSILYNFFLHSHNSSIFTNFQMGMSNNGNCERSKTQFKLFGIFCQFKWIFLNLPCYVNVFYSLKIIHILDNNKDIKTLNRIHYIAFNTLHSLHCIHYIAFITLHSLLCIHYIAFITLY